MSMTSSASGSEDAYDDGDQFNALAAEADGDSDSDVENPFDSLDTAMSQEALGDGDENPFAGL